MQKYKPLLHSNIHSSHTRFLFLKREEYFCNIIIMLVLRLEIEIIMISPHFAFSVFLQESGLLYSDSNKVRYFHLSLLFTHHLLFNRMFKFFRFCFVFFSFRVGCTHWCSSLLLVDTSFIYSIFSFASKLVLEAEGGEGFVKRK
jgi:hypothetical protein